MDPYYTFHMYERNYIIHEPIKTNSKFVSEIVNVDSLINAKDNEVKEIPGYFLRFSPMLTQKSVDGTKEFVMVKKENLTPLTTFFLNKSPVDTISHIISSFIYILESFEILINNNIVNVNYPQIAFRENLTPVLFDFGINKSIPPYYLPIELYVLNCFLKDKKKPTLSIQNIEEICLKYSKVNSIKMEREKLHKCVNFFTNVVNKQRNEIIRILSQYKYQWHIFGVSSVFIQLINILDINNLPKFISDVLFRCVSLLPTERLTQKEINKIWQENRVL